MADKNKTSDESSKLVTLTSSNHHETLVQQIWNFFSDKRGVDHDFQLDGRSIRAHRLIVEAFLPQQGLEKLSATTLTQTDLDPTIDNINDQLTTNNFDHLIEFLYRGTVSVLEQNLDTLLATAKELQFQMLVEVIESAKRASEIETRLTGRKQRTENTKKTYKEDASDIESNVDEDWTTPVKNRSHLSRASKNKMMTASKIKAAKSVISSAKRKAAGTATVKKKLVVVKMSHAKNRDASVPKFRVIATSGDEPFNPVNDCNDLTAGDNLEKESAAASADEDKVQQRKRKINAAVVRRKKAVVGGVKRIPKSFVDPLLELDKREWKRAWYANLPFLNCDHCPYKTRCQNRMKIHQAKHDANVKVHRCDLCSRAYLTAESLARHKSRHTTYKCPHCSFETEKQISHYQHLYYKHKLTSAGQPVEKKCRCSQCSFTCVYECELKKHVATKHSNDRPFQCHLCQYSSTRKADLGKHIRNAHLHIKNHICEICGHRWATQYHLDRHKRTHAGEKLLVKNESGQPVCDSPAVKIHSSEARPFICHVCAHSCSRQDNLKVHLRNVHKIIP